ncbi:hypothetical protein CL617_04520 [archaeon]|nr:hypothetical protein [archaeon]|tara:strand:- start:1844 stop:3088 length:1245 start_codon:yes stop_codon:yes gene_type:complete
MVDFPNVKCENKHHKIYYSGNFCPVCAKNEYYYNTVKSLDKESFYGSSPPNIFVGSKLAYPKVNVGILSPGFHDKDVSIYSDVNYWVKNNFNIAQIVRYRTSLINSRTSTNVFEIQKDNRLIELMKDVGVASKKVDVEVELKKKPSMRVNFEEIAMPMGPSAPMKKVSLTSNVKIERSVDKVTNDTDLKAVEALNYLQKKGFDEQFLQQVLSVGSVGLKKNRKLVPTKWSITAVDDQLGKNFIKLIKFNEQIDNCQLHYAEYFGNHYYILLFPDSFSYELFETYSPKNHTGILNFSSDYEGYKGRTKYADSTAGGYYTVRLGILEYLNNIKRKASAIVFRFVTEDYSVPLGVWVTRTSARKAMENNPLSFENKELMFSYLRNTVLRKFRYNLDLMLKKSLLYEELKQPKLTSFF